MRHLGRQGSELSIYFIGAVIATACNSVAQKTLLTGFCADKSILCRIAVVIAAVVVSFCVKFLWDNLLVFNKSNNSNVRKGLFFLLSSALITAFYLVIMCAIIAAGASDKILVAAGWILFGLGYFIKYLLDKRFAFGPGLAK